MSSFMEEVLWAMKQQSRHLQDLRQEIHGIWDDQAARELNSRYLNPHEDDDKQMMSSLVKQKDNLEKADAKLVSARGHAVIAGQLAVEVSEWLSETGRYLDSAYSSYDVSVSYITQAADTFPIIERLINEANQACG